MLKPKRKVSIFAIYKVQFLVLIFLLLSVVTSFLALLLSIIIGYLFAVHYTKLTLDNIAMMTLIAGMPLSVLFYTACYCIYLIFKYLKPLPVLIVIILGIIFINA